MTHALRRLLRYWWPFVAASVLLHVLLVFVPKLFLLPNQTPIVQIASIQIIRRPPPRPAATARPLARPRVPHPPTVARVRVPRPIVKAPRPVRLLALHVPHLTTPVVQPLAPPPPVVPAAAPSVEPTVLDTPPPPVPTPTARSDEDDAVSLSGWGAAIGDRLNRLKQYPEVARTRHEEGRVVVDVTLAPDGAVITANVVRSSHSAALDAEAIALIWRADPLPPPPAAYARGRTSITVQVPVSFTLS